MPSTKPEKTSYSKLLVVNDVIRDSQSYFTVLQSPFLLKIFRQYRSSVISNELTFQVEGGWCNLIPTELLERR